MVSRLLDRKAVIVFWIFVSLSFAGNAWISHELKKLDNGSAVSASPVDKNTGMDEAQEVYGIPQIDPNNDPLAPVVNTAPQKVASRNPEPSNVPDPVYETPSDSPVLVQ